MWIDSGCDSKESIGKFTEYLFANSVDVIFGPPCTKGKFPDSRETITIQTYFISTNIHKIQNPLVVTLVHRFIFLRVEVFIQSEQVVNKR